MRKKVISLIIPIVVGLFNILIILYPSEVMEAAKKGSMLWFSNVMPSLLPFFVGTNMLIGLGAVDFLGELLEPAMRPLFGVPGCGAFALVMGMSSGYPVGAKITASLREEGKISRVEAQRLMSFVNNSGPLFMVGAIGAGMFGNSNVGYFILISNFIGAILSGMLFKYYKSSENGEAMPQKRKKPFVSAIKAMEAARIKDGRPFGKLLADSVFKSMESLLIIAGFIILFSTITKVMETTGILKAFTGMLGVLPGLGNKNAAEAFIYGIMEVTNGASKLSQLGISSSTVIICAGLVSFGGLSILAQSVAFLSKTDVSAGIYFASKLLNAVLTVIIGFFLYPLFDFKNAEVTAVFAVSPVRQLMASTLIYGIVLISVVVSAVAINVSLYIRELKNRGGRLHKMK